MSSAELRRAGTRTTQADAPAAVSSRRYGVPATLYARAALALAPLTRVGSLWLFVPPRPRRDTRPARTRRFGHATITALIEAGEAVRRGDVVYRKMEPAE